MSVKGSTIGIALVAAAVGALISAAIPRTSGEAGRGRSADGKPNFNGVWQALNEAHWDLQAHEARDQRKQAGQPRPFCYQDLQVRDSVTLSRHANSSLEGNQNWDLNDYLSKREIRIVAYLPSKTPSPGINIPRNLS